MICSLDGSGLLVYNLPRRTSTSLIEIPAEDQVFNLNTFTPKGDQGEISPYNVLTLLSKKVMRKKENIYLGMMFDLILKAKIISNVWSTVQRSDILISGVKRVITQLSIKVNQPKWIYILQFNTSVTLNAFD